MIIKVSIAKSDPIRKYPYNARDDRHEISPLLVSKFEQTNVLQFPLKSSERL